MAIGLLGLPLLVLGAPAPSQSAPPVTSPATGPAAGVAAPIAVKLAPGNPAEPGAAGSAGLSLGSSFHVARDYAQTVPINVTNPSDHSIQFYLDCANPNTDLHVGFVEGGSQTQPMALQPGETQTVALAVFAQNAAQPSYSLPITAHLVGDGNPIIATTTIYLTVDLVPLNVTLDLVSTEPTTLAQTYTLTNLGAYVSDITVTAGGDAKDYASFTPIISNYAMATGAVTTFSVSPDLGKMQRESKTSVSGTLVVTGGGGSASFDVTFDATGLIQTIPMGQLALLQDDNPFWNLAVDQDSVTVLPDSHGDENGMSATISYDLTYGEGERMPVTVSLTAEPYTENPADFVPDQEASIDADGNLVTRVSMLLSQTEYARAITGATENSGAVSPQAVPTILSRSTSGPGLVVKGAGDWFKVGVKTVTDHLSDSRMVRSFIRSAWQVVSLLDDVNDFWKDSQCLVSVLNNPDLSWQQKAPFIAWSVSGLALSAIPVGVGVLTVLGFVSGGALLAIGLLAVDITATYLGDLMDEWKEKYNLTDDCEPVIRKPVRGSQCTNAGRISTAVQVPALLNPDGSIIGPDDVTVTTRGTPGQNLNGPGPIPTALPEPTTTIVNGKDTGINQQWKLTDPLIVNIPGTWITPGTTNYINQTFPNVNGGHYFMATDTTVDMHYPIPAVIGYIVPGGTPPDARHQIPVLPDVRPLPDFSVYPSGVKLVNAPVINEPNQLAITVYNLGALGGWADITVADDSGVIYTDSQHTDAAHDAGTSRYLAGGSSATITVPWTPTGEKSTITVSLVNKTVDTEEYNSDNNTTSVLVETRDRAVPVVALVGPEAAMTNGQTILTADLTNATDVKEVTFSVDGQPTSAASQVVVLQNGQTRFYAAADPLSPGEHTAKVDVVYADSLTTTQTVSTTWTLAVAEWTPPVVSLSQTTWAPGYEAATTTLTVATNRAAWEATSDQPWLAVSPTSGATGAQPTLAVEANRDRSSRTGTVTVTAGEATATVTVTQQAAPPPPSVDVSSTTWWPASAAGSLSVTVTTNQPTWSAASDQPWLTVAPNSGASGDQATLAVVPNPDLSPRTGSVTITAGLASATVTVTQQGTAPPPTDFTITNGGTPISVQPGRTSSLAITTSAHAGLAVTFAKESGPEWATVSPSGVITVVPGEDVAPGQFAVVVTATGGDVTHSATYPVTVTSPSVTVTGLPYSLPSARAKYTVTVTAREVGWTLTGLPLWISASRTSGPQGTTTVTLKVKALKRSASRPATLTFTSGGTIVTQTVVQSPPDPKGDRGFLAGFLGSLMRVVGSLTGVVGRLG